MPSQPTRGAILAFCEVREGVVHCPLHAWGFRLDDGSCSGLPRVAVDTYRVTVEGGDVLVEL